MRAEKVGYSQPCRTPVAGTTVDIHVVSDALLSTSGIPASLPITQPTLSGRIVEQTPLGVQPVTGARVTADFSGGMGWEPSASTTSDRDGGYLLCGVDKGPLGLALYIEKTGYRSALIPVDLGAGRKLDVELSREQQ